MVRLASGTLLVLLGVALASSAEEPGPGSPDLPKSVVRVFGTHPIRHGAKVSAVAVDAAQHRVLVGLWDGSVQLWTVAGRRGRRIWDAHGSAVLCAALSGDGRIAATGSGDGVLKLWRTGSAETIRSIAIGEDWLLSVALTGDGSRALVGSADGAMSYVDTGSGTVLRRLPVSGVWLRRVAFLRGENRAITGDGDGVLRILDLVGDAKPEVLGRLEGAVSGLAVHPRLPLVAAGSDSGPVTVWDLEGNESREVISDPGPPVHALAFHPRRAALLVGAGPHILVQDPAFGGGRRVIGKHGSPILGLAFSPSGREILSGSAEDADWDDLDTVRWWRYPDGGELPTFTGHTKEVTALDISGDGTRLLSGARDGTVRLWNLATGVNAETFSVHYGEVADVAFDPAGWRLVSVGSDGQVWLRDLRGGVNRILGRDLGRLFQAAFSPDGRHLAVAGRDLLVLWDLAETNGGKRIPGPGADVGFAWGRDGWLRLARTTQRGTSVQHLEPWSGLIRRSFLRPTKARTVFFDESGRHTLLAGDASGSGAVLECWGSSPREPVHWRVSEERDRETQGAALSPDGRLLLTVDSTDLIARDPETGVILRRYGGGGNRVAFLPDGRHAVTAGGRALYLWRLTDPEEPGSPAGEKPGATEPADDGSDGR